MRLQEHGLQANDKGQHPVASVIRLEGQKDSIRALFVVYFFELVMVLLLTVYHPSRHFFRIVRGAFRQFVRVALVQLNHQGAQALDVFRYFHIRHAIKIRFS